MTANIKDKIIDRVIRDAPELVILEMDGQVSQTVLHELVNGEQNKTKIAGHRTYFRRDLNHPGDYLGVDDFMVQPYDEPGTGSQNQTAVTK